MIELVFIGYLREISRWFYDVTCRDYYHHHQTIKRPSRMEVVQPIIYTYNHRRRCGRTCKDAISSSTPCLACSVSRSDSDQWIQQSRAFQTKQVDWHCSIQSM